MPRSHLIQTSRLLLPQATRSAQPSRLARCRNPTTQPIPPVRIHTIRRPFSTCTARPRSIAPTVQITQRCHYSTEGPVAAKPADLTDGKYHELADVWLENALVKFEDLQDEGKDIDVEYSSGVMTVRTEEQGTYVLNKQPPNKQIWLSSPLSGPKRYDWCIFGDGQGDKEGTSTGRWVYTRDQTTIDQLILEELGVDLEAPTPS